MTLHVLPFLSARICSRVAPRGKRTGRKRGSLWLLRVSFAVSQTPFHVFTGSFPESAEIPSAQGNRVAGKVPSLIHNIPGRLGVHDAVNTPCPAI